VTPNSKWPPKISRSKGMLHTQIANAVASSISLGHFRTGDRLPPERELAKEFGVNRLTVRQALADLQLRKLILRRTGRNGGTFIASQSSNTTSQPSPDFPNRPAVSVTSPARGCCELNASKPMRRRPSAAAVEGEEVFEIDRLRFANDLPVLLEHSSFPAERFAGLLSEPLHGSIYELLERRYDARPVARGRANLTGRRECAHRAPTGRHPGHAATARRT